MEEEAATRGLPVLNATCPLVTKVHNQGKRYMSKGRALILIGHAGHPEVEGTMGQVPGPVLLVQNVDDVAALTLPADTPVAYITQTTLSVDDTKDIIAALQQRFTDIQGPDIRDICYATQNRQSAVRDLSKLVDVILVVGATNSSNSNRLREIGTEVGVASYLIADGSELNPDWLKDAKAVGITAGASAPEVLVDDVIKSLRRLGRSTSRCCRAARRRSSFVCRRSWPRSPEGRHPGAAWRSKKSLKRSTAWPFRSTASCASAPTSSSRSLRGESAIRWC